MQLNKGVVLSSKDTPSAVSLKQESDDSDDGDDERDLDACPICGVSADKYTHRTSFLRHVQKANCTPGIFAVDSLSTSSGTTQSKKKGDDSIVKTKDKSSDAKKVESCPKCGVTQKDFVYPHSFRKHLGRCTGGAPAPAKISAEKRGIASSSSSSVSSQRIVAESKGINKVKRASASKESPPESEHEASVELCPHCGDRADNFAAPSSFARHIKSCVTRRGKKTEGKTCSKCGVPKDRYAFSSSYYKHVTNCTGLPWVEPGSADDPVLEKFGGPVQECCPECGALASSYSLWNSYIKHVARCNKRAARYRELIHRNRLDEVPSEFLERELARQSQADSASADVSSSRPSKRAKTKGDSSSSSSSVSLPPSSLGKEESSEGKSRGKVSRKEFSEKEASAAAKFGEKLLGKGKKNKIRNADDLQDGGNYRPARVKNDQFDPFGAPRGTVHAGGGYGGRKTENMQSVDLISLDSSTGESEDEIEIKPKNAVTKRKRKEVEEEEPEVVKSEDSKADRVNAQGLSSCPRCNVAAALFSFNSSFTRHVSTCKGDSGAPHGGRRLGSVKTVHLGRESGPASKSEEDGAGKNKVPRKLKVQDPSSESDDSSLEEVGKRDGISEELYGTNGRPLRAKNSFNPFGALRGTVHNGGGLGAPRQFPEEINSRKLEQQRAEQSPSSLSVSVAVAKSKAQVKAEKEKASVSQVAAEKETDAVPKKNMKSCPHCDAPSGRFQHLHSFYRHVNNCESVSAEQQLTDAHGGKKAVIASAGFGLGRIGKGKKIGSLVSSRALSKVAARPRLSAHSKSITDANLAGGKIPGKKKFKVVEAEVDRELSESEEVEPVVSSSKRSSRVDATANEVMQLDVAQPTYFKRNRKEENEVEPHSQLHTLLSGEIEFVAQIGRVKGTTSKKQQPTLQKQQDSVSESIPESVVSATENGHGHGSRSSRSPSESNSDSELSVSSIASLPDSMMPEKGGSGSSSKVVARPQTYMQMISPHLKAASDGGQKVDATKVFDEDKKCVDLSRVDISGCVPAFQRNAEEFRLAREKELENRIWCPGVSDDEEEAKDLERGLKVSKVSKDEERLLYAHAANLYLPPATAPKAQREKLLKSKLMQSLGEQQFLVRLARFARAGKHFKNMSNEEIRREIRVRAAHIKVGGGSIHAAALAVIQEVESWPADGLVSPSTASRSPSNSGAFDLSDAVLNQADAGKGSGAETAGDQSPPRNFMPATYTPSAVTIVPPSLRYDRGAIPYYLSCAYDEISKAMYRSLVASASAYIARVRKAEKTRLDSLREKLKLAGSRRNVDSLGPAELYNQSQQKRYSNPGYIDLLNIKDEQIVPVVDGTFMFHKPGVPANLFKILNASGGNVQQALDVLRTHLSTSNAGDGELCDVADSHDEDEEEGSLSQSSNDEGEENPRVKKRPPRQVRVPRASSGGSANMTVESYITAWSIWEQARFQTSFAKYGPDFSRIARAVPTKSRAEVIDYYFRFVEAAQELQKCDLKAKDYNTHQHGGDVPAALVVDESDSALEKEMDIDSDAPVTIDTPSKRSHALEKSDMPFVGHKSSSQDGKVRSTGVEAREDFPDDVMDIEEISAIRETIDAVSEVVRGSSSRSSSTSINSSKASSKKCKRDLMFNPDSKTDTLRVDSIKFLIRAKEELTDVAFALLLNTFKAFTHLNHENPAQMIVRARSIFGHSTLSSHNRALGVAGGEVLCGSSSGGSSFPLQCPYSDCMPLEPSGLNKTYGFDSASAAYAELRHAQSSATPASLSTAAALAIPQGRYSIDGDVEELEEDVSRPTRVRKLSSKVEETMFLHQGAVSKSEASFAASQAAKSGNGHYGGTAQVAWSSSKADKLKSAEEQAFFAALSCSEPKTPNAANPFTLRGSMYCKPDDKYQLDRKYHHLSKGASSDAAKLGRTAGRDYGLEDSTADSGVPFAKSLFAEFLAMLPTYIADQAGKNRA